MSISDNVTLTVNSPCAEQPVPGVAQARQDVAVLVELPVEGSRVHGHVGVGGEHRLDALGRGDEAQEAHARGPGFLQGLDGGDGRAAGREHRVQHEKRAVLLARGDLEVVVDGLERVVVAVQADVSDARRGDELSDALDHPQAGAQDGDQGELLARHLHAAGALERRIDFDGFEGQVLGDLVGHEHRDLAGELLEVLGGGALVAQQRELVLDQRVGQYGEVGEVRVRHGAEPTPHDTTTPRCTSASRASVCPPESPDGARLMKRAISLLVFAAAAVPGLPPPVPRSMIRRSGLHTQEATMKRRIEAAAAVLAGVIAFGCEQPPPSAPTLTGPLFAAATTMDITTTTTLTITDPGNQWVSGGIFHVRNQTQSGPVTGDITGTVTVTARSDVAAADMTGTGLGEFPIKADV